LNQLSQWSDLETLSLIDVTEGNGDTVMAKIWDDTHLQVMQLTALDYGPLNGRNS